MIDSMVCVYHWGFRSYGWFHDTVSSPSEPESKWLSTRHKFQDIYYNSVCISKLYFEFAPSSDFVDTPGVVRIVKNTIPMMKQFNADESTTE